MQVVKVDLIAQHANKGLIREMRRELDDLEKIPGLQLRNSEIQLYLTKSECYILDKELIKSKLESIRVLATCLKLKN